MSATKAVSRTGAPDEECVKEIMQLLERALCLIDEGGLPADLGARLDQVIGYLSEWQKPPSS